MPMEIRTSERSSLKKCAQQWFWSQVEGLEPKHTANALWFGSAVHEALAQWYQPGTTRGREPAEVFLESLEGNRSIPVDSDEDQLKYVDARELGVAMLNNYRATYGLDEAWEVIATETTSAVLLPQRARTVFGVKLPRQPRAIRYNMTFDGVYRDTRTNEIWLMEHKTAAGIRVDHLPLDDQAGSYWAFASDVLRKRGVLKPGEEIAGIMYNFLRKALPDERPKNARGVYTNKPTKQHYLDALVGPKFAHVRQNMKVEELAAIAAAAGITVVGDESKNQPAPYFERVPVYRSRSERKKMLERIQDEAFFAQAYRDGNLPITKAPDRDRCSYCQFKEMCKLDESGDKHEVEVFKTTMYNVRNPYEVYGGKSA